MGVDCSLLLDKKNIYELDRLYVFDFDRDDIEIETKKEYSAKEFLSLLKWRLNEINIDNELESERKEYYGDYPMGIINNCGMLKIWHFLNGFLKEFLTNYLGLFLLELFRLLPQNLDYKHSR